MKKLSPTATAYTSNKVQWFFEEKNIVSIDDIDELTEEMCEEMHSRATSPGDVDWIVVEQRLSRFLAAQAKLAIERIRKTLDNEHG